MWRSFLALTAGVIVLSIIIAKIGFSTIDAATNDQAPTAPAQTSVPKPEDVSGDMADDDAYQEVDRLTALVAECGSDPTNHIPCDAHIYLPVWKTLESDTGELVKVDTTNVRPGGLSGALVDIYISPPNANFDLSRLRMLFFDCEGQFSDVLARGPMTDAPPRSLAGAVANYACPIAQQMHAEARKRQAEEWSQMGN